MGKHLHFLCNCTLGMDVRGIIEGYEIVNGEIVFLVNTGSRTIHIGENHPSMRVEEMPTGSSRQDL